MRKFTGVLPGWVASDEQKQALEKMMGQIQEEDMPDENELKKMHEKGGSSLADEGWMSSAKGMASSMSGGDAGGGGKSSGNDGRKEGKAEQDTTSAESATHGEESAGGRKKPRKLELAGNRRKPKKLEKRSSDAAASSQDREPRNTAAKSAEQREEMLKKMLREHGVTDEEIESRLNGDKAA